MKVYIVGHAGNMGARYKAVLKHLGHEWAGFDPNFGGHTGSFLQKDADGILIATPTAMHLDSLKKYRHFGKRLLCEKPIDPVAYAKLRDIVGLQAPFRMVDQYRYLIEPGCQGLTLYDYFRHGSDGLKWDCINIVRHATGQVILREESPFWTCLINGERLSLSVMDHAYVAMISDWLNSTNNEVKEVIEAHRKVEEL